MNESFASSFGLGLYCKGLFVRTLIKYYGLMFRKVVFLYVFFYYLIKAYQLKS
ncbi:hypothetical protein J2Z64_000281 [Oceanobacillus polygoni]|uniref:Uncharacterized protein n=1 Tax=Oceanobacillus polygoni TaxID=1235259 RepID=A0A9X0YRL2_9BACI|nr:hypothetical protein [Oceanobacillus polygoni]